MFRSTKILAQNWIAFATLFVAILAILYSHWTQQYKSLEITYLHKAPIIETSSSFVLNLTVNEELVTDPWIATIRIRNAGNMPIERRDIEQPLFFQFENSYELIHFSVKETGPIPFSATAHLLENRLEIEHGLLNPKDWINVDLLFDGEPNLPLIANLRISGVRLLQNSFVDQISSQPLEKWIDDVVPISYVFVALSSLLAVASFVMGLYCLFDGTRSIVRRRQRKRYTLERAAADNFAAENLAERYAPKARATVVIAKLLEPIEMASLFNKPHVVEAIEARVPASVLETLKMSADEAAERIVTEAKEQVGEYIINIINQIFSIRVTDQIRNKFLSRQDLQLQELAQVAKSFVIENGKDWYDWKYGDAGGSFMGAVIFVTLGISVAFVATPYWRSIFAV